jgi:hypothetical protein
MAYANDIDVVQKASKVLASNDVMVERIGIFYDKLETMCLKMEYHQCKADSSNDRLEKPQVDKDVTCRWSFFTSGWSEGTGACHYQEH